MSCSEVESRLEQFAAALRNNNTMGCVGVFSVYSWVHVPQCVRPRGIKFMADSRCSADPFVMTSSVKCFSHHKTPYAVCSDSIIWLCVLTTATIYSYSNHHAFPGPHTQPQAWSKQLFFHLLFQLLFFG